MLFWIFKESLTVSQRDTQQLNVRKVCSQEKTDEAAQPLTRILVVGIDEGDIYIYFFLCVDVNLTVNHSLNDRGGGQEV